MPTLVFSILIFVGLGVFFLLFHLLLGMLVRPIRPEKDKLTIYECGEPTIGSAWIQFDLRYYVVALLFVIFDVEVAFFFPWATVFGKANTLAQSEAYVSMQQREKLSKELVPEFLHKELFTELVPASEGKEAVRGVNKETAGHLARVGFIDIAVFFGVLLVGFAYLWKRGDLNWVRSTAAEKEVDHPTRPPPALERIEQPVPTGQSA